MGCIHHWLCETGEDGKVPAVCLKCGTETVFEPRFIDGRSALDFDRPWADLRLLRLAGADRGDRVAEG